MAEPQKRSLLPIDGMSACNAARINGGDNESG
jgi:hypothetical protein